MTITVTPTVVQMGQTLTITLPANCSCRVLCYFGLQTLIDGTYTDKAVIPLIPGVWLPQLPTCADTRLLPPNHSPWVEVEAYDKNGQFLQRWGKRFDIVVGQEFAPELDWLLTADNTLSQIMKPSYGGLYFQGVSRVQAATEARCWDGATLVKTAMEIEGKTYEGLNETLISHVLTTMGQTVVKISATDSRGLTTTYQETITITPYSRPVAVVGEQGIYRCDDKGNPDDGGSYLYVHAAATTYPLTEGNTGYLRYRITLVGSTPGSFSSANLQSGILPGVMLLPEYNYTLELLPCDQVCQGNVLQITVPKRGVYAHQTDDGLALGMYRQDGGLEVGWPARFYNTVTLGSTTLTEDTLKKLLKLL